MPDFPYMEDMGRFFVLTPLKNAHIGTMDLAMHDTFSTTASPQSDAPDAQDPWLQTLNQAQQQARAAQTAKLQRMKHYALLALLAAIALLIASEYHQRQGIWSWLGAFAEAATVGALADWFAVVALFRHPLGLPLPHTAIIMHNQQRVADSLAQFVRDRFLAQHMLQAEITRWNPAHRLGAYLADADHTEQLGVQLRDWMAHALKALDDTAIERGLARLMRQQLQDWNAAPTLSVLMRWVMQQQYHQHMLDAGLHKLAQWLQTPTVRAALAAKIAELIRREYPKLSWISHQLQRTDQIANSLADKVATSLIAEVQQILTDAQHPLRQHYAGEVAQLLQRLHHDAYTQHAVQQLKDSLLQHPVFQDYVQQLWQRLRDWLHHDLTSESSVLQRQFVACAVHIGQQLRDDNTWQQTLNTQLHIAVEHLGDKLRDIAPRHIRNTIMGWSAEQMAQEIELGIGCDLQYIRLNGTLIGGLIGLLLHAVL